MKKYQINWMKNRVDKLKTFYIYLAGGILSNACRMQYKDYY